MGGGEPQREPPPGKRVASEGIVLLCSNERDNSTPQEGGLLEELAI
jgi:hypothetical protein